MRVFRDSSPSRKWEGARLRKLNSKINILTWLGALLFTLGSSFGALASEAPFKKVIVFVFENTNYEGALQQSFFSGLARHGALLSNFHAVAHPSQPNYIAMIAGSPLGVDSDRPVDLTENHLGDLLEQSGKTWKVYADGFPGDCFTGRRKGKFVRKHVPFLSFQNIQKSAARCANIVSGSELKSDLKQDRLPDFSMYIPDLDHDGHDTSVEFADHWFKSEFGEVLRDENALRDVLVVVTFDESDDDPSNHIYTALFGSGVRPGSVADTAYDHYSVLRTIEDGLGIGTLGRNDSRASRITGIWK